MNKKRKFVVLFHEMPGESPSANHWDLMLEANGYLETWSLPKLPTAETTIHATKLAPHRMDYLSYEGPVSNNRGQVTRVMSGQFVGEVFPDNSPQEFELTLWTDNKQLGVQFKFVDEDIWEIQFSSYG